MLWHIDGNLAKPVYRQEWIRGETLAVSTLGPAGKRQTGLQPTLNTIVGIRFPIVGRSQDEDTAGFGRQHRLIIVGLVDAARVSSHSQKPAMQLLIREVVFQDQSAAG